jgi:hypothetical protein
VDLEAYLFGAFHHRFNRALKKERRRQETIELLIRYAVSNHGSQPYSIDTPQVYQLDGVRLPQSLYGFVNSQLGDEQIGKLKVKQETPVRVFVFYAACSMRISCCCSCARGRARVVQPDMTEGTGRAPQKFRWAVNVHRCQPDVLPHTL